MKAIRLEARPRKNQTPASDGLPVVACLEDAPVPEPGPGEVLLRLRATALGATEQAVLSGLLPLGVAPGSEFTADVVQDREGELVGARVAPLPSVPCGACGPCLAGNATLCPVRLIPGRSARYGCLAEYFLFPRRGLFRLPHGLRDFDAISLLPLASALNLPRKISLPGRVLVVSAGGLGLVVAASLRGLRQLLFLAMPNEDAIESVRKFSLHRDPGGRFPLVVAACDGPGVLARALDRVAPQGTLAVLGMPDSPSPVLPLVHRELTVIGIGEGEVTAAIKCMEEREVCEILSRARPTIFPFAQADRALAHAADPSNLRVIVDNLDQ